MPRIVFRILLASFVTLPAIFSGCSGKTPQTDRREFAKTYAGLALLYEDLKLNHQTPDLAYHDSVRTFLKSRGTDEEGFKRETDQIRSDIGSWRRFLVLVTADVDSMRRARQAVH